MSATLRAAAVSRCRRRFWTTAQPLGVDVTQQLLVAGQEVSLRASFSLTATSEVLRTGRSPPPPPPPPRMSSHPPPPCPPLPLILQLSLLRCGSAPTSEDRAALCEHRQRWDKKPPNPDFSSAGEVHTASIENRRAEVTRGLNPDDTLCGDYAHKFSKNTS